VALGIQQNEIASAIDRSGQPKCTLLEDLDSLSQFQLLNILPNGTWVCPG
jgi:hypothetical protein